MGKVLRSGITANDEPLVLFDRDRGRFVPDRNGAAVALDGRTGRIGGVLRRAWYRDVHQHFEAINRDTTREANKRSEKGGRFALGGMVFGASARFIHLYFLRMGFRDGVRGLIYCLLDGYAVFILHAKVWEIRRAKRRERKRSS